MQEVLIRYMVRICFIAGFHSVVSRVLDTSSIKPCVPEGLMTVNVTYGDDKTFNLPMINFTKTFNLSEGLATGTCPTDIYTTVDLFSDDRKLKFVLTFEVKAPKIKGENPELFLADVSMFVVGNVKETQQSIGKSKRGRGQTYSTGTTDKPLAGGKQETLVFETPVYDARCHRKHEVMYHSKQAYASLAFSQVRFQPYRDLALHPNKQYICPQDLIPAPTYNKHGEYLVPIILGLSVTVVIALLVIGYLVHKKVEGMGYASMD